MRTKKLMAILIAIAFFLSVISCFCLLFSVRKINITFSVSNNFDTDEVVECLDEFTGENLLFIDLNEIKDTMCNYPYLEITSIKKDYPNIISLSLRERREVYDLIYEDKVISTSSDGYVLNITNIEDWQGESRDKILLETYGIEFSQVEVGKFLTSNDDDFIKSVFDMAEAVDLTDCIKSLKIELEPYLKKDAVFTTYTGVSIVITEANERGRDKIEKAFNAYYDKANDYQKTFGVIEVNVLTETGDINVLWSPRIEVTNEE